MTKQASDQPDATSSTSTPTVLIDHGVPNLERKASLLIAFMVLLVCAASAYVMYARGAFASTQRLVLIAEDSEGVAVGMNLTFAGFAIGRVHHVELGQDGKAHILIDVTEKDAHWLRVSSIFTLSRGMVGAPSIRAFTGIPNDPPLPDGAERTALEGDLSAELPRVVAAARELLENLSALTRSDGAVGESLENVKQLTGRANGPHGAVGVLLGSDAEASKVSKALEHANTLLMNLDKLTAHADTQVFGTQGVMPQTQAAISQITALLSEARTSLQKVDAVLVNAQAISANAKEASTDLGALRGEVDASLRKVQDLITEINRKWPFAKDTELHLP